MTQSLYIGVEPYGSVETDSATGIQVLDFVNPHLLKSLIVRVTSVPDRIPFYGNDVASLYSDYGKTRSWYVNKMASDLTKFSSEYGSPVEVVPGDLCIVRHLVHLDEGPLRSMRYDHLVARINADGSLYPLNGQLLLEMPAEDSPMVDFSRKYENKLTQGRVIAQGCDLEGYLLYNRTKDAPGEEFIGRTVFFRPYAAVRIENDNHRMLDYETPWPYYRISKPQILGYHE